MDNLTEIELKDKLQKWANNKLVNPITNRKIKLNGPTYKKLEKKYTELFNNKIILYERNDLIEILRCLEFRSRELYLTYCSSKNKMFLESKIFCGPIIPPSENVRKDNFYNLLTSRKIPEYAEYINHKNDEDNTKIGLLHETFYEYYKYNYFNLEDIISELSDIDEYMVNNIDKMYINNAKYKNLKKINKNKNKENLICDKCGNFLSTKYLCNKCMVNIYCSINCKNKDSKIHYNCCKYYNNQIKTLKIY